jgi:endonuclease-8
MPEGDTILRTARTLERALSGKRVVKFESVYPQLDSRLEAPLVGQTVARVYANGKHLLIDFSGGQTLRTHMRMNGSWHIYRRGEKWQRPHRDMRIVLATDDYEAVAFLVPEAEVVKNVARHDRLRALGPDILGDDFDLAEARRRLRAKPEEEIGNVLLNQRVIAGIGNIYKSESLFLAGVLPFHRVDELTDAQLDAIVESARTLMRASVAATTDVRRWVYERPGRLCRRCRTLIEFQKQGLDARGTYWCPSCQK